MGFDFMRRIIAITKAMALTKISDSLIDRVERLSFNFLRSTKRFFYLLNLRVFSKTH
jgi:hypothetical protein